MVQKERGFFIQYVLGLLLIVVFSFLYGEGENSISSRITGKAVDETLILGKFSLQQIMLLIIILYLGTIFVLEIKRIRHNRWVKREDAIKKMLKNKKKIALKKKEKEIKKGKKIKGEEEDEKEERIIEVEKTEGLVLKK